MTGLHVGLIVNPLAGLGGSLAYKGSDGPELRRLAASRGARGPTRAMQRVERALRLLDGHDSGARFSCFGGDMGADSLSRCHLPYRTLGEAAGYPSSAEDTREAARALRAAGVDLLLFGGGDGTARDICQVVGSSLPVLGVPAGVKMHSGVFAVSPEAAGELLVRLAAGGLVGLQLREVRDIDEVAFRRDVVRSRHFGDMSVPGDSSYLQHTKIGGREDVELAAADIAAWLAEQMSPEVTYLVGPGSTTAALMQALGLDNTLLGVDVVRDGRLLLADADEAGLLALLDGAGPAEIIVTAIGGQGHVFGRGNQQFSPAVIRRVGLDRITIVAAKSKIAELEGRPLLVDTDDPELDRALGGFRSIVTGYDDHILYRVGSLT